MILLKLYASALFVMATLDALWLGLILKSFYSAQLGSFLKVPFGWAPAVLFYLLYSAALVILVTEPALQGQWSNLKIAGMGAVLGLAAYGAYDLTNLATLKGWPVQVVVVDMAWGAIMTAGVAVLSILITRALS